MSTYPAVSIIIPTRNRSKFLESRLDTIRRNTSEIGTREAELILVVDKDDEESNRIGNFNTWISKVIAVEPLTIPAVKWNIGAQLSNGEWLVTLSDDCIPQPNWLKNALELITYGFIGLPDGVTKDRNYYFTPLYMARKDWLRKYHGGVLVIPHYKSWYADIETAWRARRAGHFMIGVNSVVTQLHEIFGTAEADEIYKLGESRRAEDLKVYNERSIKGFPDDFESVI